MSKFTLTRVSGAPVSDDELLNDVKRVAEALHARTVRWSEYKVHGIYDPSTLQRRFLSWGGALEKAGLERRERTLPVEVLLADIARAASELSQKTLSIEQYRRIGNHDHMTIRSKFNSWNDALEAVGLERSKHTGLSDEVLFENILRLWQFYGRQPRRSELKSAPSTISQQPYWRRFGSWTVALELFVEYANLPERAEDEYMDMPVAASSVIVSEIPPSIGGYKLPIGGSEISENVKQFKTQSAKRTGRDPSLRLRFKVLQRDSFTCQQCGRSPATLLGLVLHIDHKFPWSKGGETVIENLWTLCADCNLGKSNLFPI
jgi:Homing endonuclease associated repeat/HNH endonuclease